MSNPLTRYHKYFIFFVGFLLVILFHTTDRYISHHPSLIIFYIIPVSLVTWFSGAAAGALIALCSIASWLPKDISVIKSLYTYPIFFYVNMVTRASFLFIVVYVLQRLKIALKHEEELNRLKSVFVANVSHELKNPLGLIKEALSLILEGFAGETNPRQKGIIESGKRNTERLIRLVTDLLDLSKIEAGKMELRSDKTDIVLLVNEILKDHEAEISKKALVLKKDIQQNVGLVQADKDKLMEVMINLLNNAIKYTPSGSIAVNLSGDEKEVRFEIVDTGPGIPQEDIKKIFDKFERVTAEKKEGTGLGLSIAKDIIELHKGKIWVESTVGKGSKFIFILPRDFKKL
ncbi:MAG: HAMP domain-containing sensor histidine kinase [Candidatus Omnitrophica bacterium]|nr:HAMP domain-containing sensor histidine kinase [Candidatus Omnitrophota bacterium]